MNALLVGPRPLSPHEVSVATARTWDYVVAVDGGADRCAEIGIHPSVIIGDMDSVSSRLSPPPAAALEQHPTDKDYSDLDAAVRHVNEITAQRVTAVGLSGGRIDHTITVASSLGTLTATSVQWIGPGEETQYVGPGQVVTIEPFSTFSVIPVLGTSRVTITGARWNLDGVELSQLSTVGLSNESLGSGASVTVVSGARTMVVTQQQG